MQTTKIGTRKANRTLIVEDEGTVAMLLEIALVDMGHGVCAIEGTADGAVATAAYYHPDLMIVDAGLGGSSGMAAMAEILRGGYVPHIFISGSFLPQQIIGDAVFLRKPFSERDLDRAIQYVLARPVVQ